MEDEKNLPARRVPEQAGPLRRLIARILDKVDEMADGVAAGLGLRHR